MSKQLSGPALIADCRAWWNTARKIWHEGGVNEWYWRAVMREIAALEYAQARGWRVALTPCQTERQGR